MTSAGTAAGSPSGFPCAVRVMTGEDWPAVETIFRAGINTGNATFAEAPPGRRGFFESHVPDLNLVAEAPAGRIVGWAAASPTSGRTVYRGVLEHSVYVDPDSGEQGVGATLLKSLISRARRLGYWTLQASIFPENASSLRLHARLGFREVGRRERIGYMTHGPFAGHWRDTVLVEIRL